MKKQIRWVAACILAMAMFICVFPAYAAGQDLYDNTYAYAEYPAANYSSEIMNILQSFVANGIRENGYYKFRYKDSLYGYEYTITYNNDAERLLFHSSQDGYIIQVDYDLASKTVVNSHVNYFGVISGEVYANAPINMKSYALGDTLTFVIDKTRTKASSVDNAVLQATGNAAAMNAMNYWNALLQSKTGYTLNALGFSGIAASSSSSSSYSTIDMNEPNESKTAATMLTVGRAYSGEIGSYSKYRIDGRTDTDFFAVNLEKGRKYRINIDPFTSAFASTSLIIKLYDPNDRDTSFSHTMVRNGVDYYDFAAEQTGKYYIQLFNFTDVRNKTDHPYVIKIEQTSKAGWMTESGYWYYYDKNGCITTGWQKVGSNWYYLSTGNGIWEVGDEKYGIMVTGLQNIDGSKYYFKDTGALQIGWVQIDGRWHYFGKNGKEVTGWINDNGKWYYLKSFYELATGYYSVDGTKYYFNNKGVMQTGWIQVDGKWKYFAASGKEVTGWVKYDSKWYYVDSYYGLTTGFKTIDGVKYYFNTKGAMQTGWKKVSGAWYYMGSNGAVTVSWKKIDNKWYYFDSSGALATGTQLINGTWYYFGTDGNLCTGWQKVDGEWHYYNANGSRASGWKKIDGTWYYFTEWGSMATGTVYIDGKEYKFKSNGAWIG